MPVPDEVRDLGERAREASAGMALQGRAPARRGSNQPRTRESVEQLGHDLETHMAALEREIAGTRTPARVLSRQ